MVCARKYIWNNGHRYALSVEDICFLKSMIIRLQKTIGFMNLLDKEYTRED